MADTIRVLIVEDRPVTVANLRKLLSFESDIEVVGTAEDGIVGVDLAKRLLPDVVLMDVNMPRMDGLTATATITKDVPQVSVVLMSVQGGVEYVRRGMQSGAMEYLTKPFTADELVASVHRAAERSERMRVMAQPQEAVAATPAPRREQGAQGSVVTVLSAKGGVGTTLLAINIATQLQIETSRVCLVDLDLQYGDVGVMLNLQHHSNIVTLIERIEELDDDLLDSCLADGPEHLKILLAPLSPEMAELVVADHVHKLLAALRRRFEYVVVDAGDHLGEQTLAAIDDAKMILAVSEVTLAGLKNTKLLVSILHTLHVDQERLMVISNGYGAHLQRGTAELAEAIQYPITVEVPAALPHAARSIEKAVPLVGGQSGSDFSKAIRQVVAATRRKLGDDRVVSEKEEPSPDRPKRFGLPGVR